MFDCVKLHTLVDQKIEYMFEKVMMLDCTFSERDSCCPRSVISSINMFLKWYSKSRFSSREFYTRKVNER